MLSVILGIVTVIFKNTSGFSEKEQSINAEDIPSFITMVMEDKVNNEEDNNKLITEIFYEVN